MNDKPHAKPSAASPCRRQTRQWQAGHRQPRSVRHRSAERVALLLPLLAGLGCAAPDPGRYNCDSTCKTPSDCADGMVCRDAFCVHPGMQGFCSVSDALGAAGMGSLSNLGGTTGLNNSGANTLASFVGSAAAATAAGTAVQSQVGDSQTAAAGVARSGTGEPTASSGGMAQGGIGVVGNTKTDGTEIHGVGGSPAGGTGISVASGGGTPSGGSGPPAGGGSGAPQSGMGGLAGSGGTSSTAGVAGASQCAAADLPIIATASSLPTGCSTQVYETELQATGGAPSDLEWMMITPPPAESSIGLTGNKLGGVLGKASSSPYEMTIAVRNKATGCVSAPRTFYLEVTSETLTGSGCPGISIVDKGRSDTSVPPFCRGWPYLVDFKVFTPNQATYTWSGASSLPELKFDPTTASISGTPASPGTITLQLTETTPTATRVFRKTYDVPLRDACWLAYLDGNPGEERLHLDDPYLTDPYPTEPYRRPRIKDPPESSKVTGISVTDYQFSPNGKFLAYRVKDTNGLQTLWIWQGPSWEHEQSLTFEPQSSVTYYAWSGDSNVLAVAYTTADRSTKLGGIDVSLVDASQSAPGVQGIRKLAPVAAPVSSDLTWYQTNTHVAFASPVDPSQPQDAWLVSCAELGLAGFSSPQSPGIAAFDASVVLFPGSAGFFATNTVDPLLYFYAPQQYPHDNETIAPSGNYTASASGDTLRVFLANTSSFAQAPTPFATANHCTQLLAWGAQQEWLACVDGTDASIHAYAFDPQKAELTDYQVTDTTGLFGQSWQEHRRLISSHGQRLAVALDNHLYVVSLSQSPPSVVLSKPFRTSVKSTGFSFSPDEEAIVFQRDQSLTLYDTTSSDLVKLSLGDTDEAAPSCQEQTLMIPNWCGRNVPTAHVKWSTDSGLIAFHSSTGELWVRDIRSRREEYLEPITVIVSACEGACVGGFEFQP